MNAERLAEIRAKYESAVSAARSPGGVEELRDFIANYVPELLASETPLDEKLPDEESLYFISTEPATVENVYPPPTDTDSRVRPAPDFPVYGNAEPEEGPVETWPV